EYKAASDAQALIGRLEAELRVCVLTGARVSLIAMRQAEEAGDAWIHERDGVRCRSGHMACRHARQSRTGCGTTILNLAIANLVASTRRPHASGDLSDPRGGDLTLRMVSGESCRRGGERSGKSEDDASLDGPSRCRFCNGGFP